MLVFTLKRGESFYVGDQKVQLVEFGRAGVVLRTDGTRLWLTGPELVELPGAFAWRKGVRVCAKQQVTHAVRVGIEAPADVKILRERLYLQASRPASERAPNRFHSKAMNCADCQGRMKVRQGGRWVPCPAAQNPSLPICNPRG